MQKSVYNILFLNIVRVIMTRDTSPIKIKLKFEVLNLGKSYKSSLNVNFVTQSTLITALIRLNYVLLPWDDNINLAESVLY